LERLLTLAFQNPNDTDIAALLKSARVFAVIGASPKPDRPVYGVMERLIAQGYAVVPVNPGQTGARILGQTVYASLADTPAPVDIVDIFRAPDAALATVEDAIEQKDRLGLKAVWMQLGVINEEAARRAQGAGLTVVMDRCPKIELGRLGVIRA
jgi:predicted CoA-binding protein